MELRPTPPVPNTKIKAIVTQTSLEINKVPSQNVMIGKAKVL